MATNTFLVRDDYLHRIQDKHLKMIIEENDNFLEDAEVTAQSVITDALYSRFDTDNIFNKTGDERHPTVMRWMINLVLYYIHERIPDKLVPERIVKNYDDTLFILYEIADGKKSIDLPRLKNENDTLKTKFRWGSEKRRSHHS